MGKPSVQSRMCPEMAAGGYTRKDSTIQFYLRINALLEPHMTVVDLGAGRGSFLEHPCKIKRDLQCLRGKVKEVIGLDIDPIVSTNPALDRSDVIEIGGAFPLADQSVDLIVSDWTLEHVDIPEAFVAEVQRVLRPGGWFCARTPSKWSLTAFGARLVPNAMHSTLLRRIQPQRKEIDVFPTRYRMNSFSDLKRLFPTPLWRHASYGWAGDPAYHFENSMVWRVTAALFTILPQNMASHLLIFIQKVGA